MSWITSNTKDISQTSICYQNLYDKILETVVFSDNVNENYYFVNYF